MASNIKKVLGIINKKKPDDSDDESCSYSDPTMVHSTEPPKSHGVPPHYPPPRPQHSPNPSRKITQDVITHGNKRPQTNDNKRNSGTAFSSGEPRRAPPRPNIAKKSNEDDYCDPIDVQRKEDFVLEKKSTAKDDYCEPWDSTTKTNFRNKPAQKNQQDNEYMDPYDAGRESILEKRISRGLGKDLGVLHGKLLSSDQPKKSGMDQDSKVYDEVYEPRKGPPADANTDDYDMPWEWKKQAQMGKMKLPKPKPLVSQNQRPKPGSAAGDDYDEPWEKKQGYMLQNTAPGSGKPRSPVPLPRTSSTGAKNPEGQFHHRLREHKHPNGQSDATNQEPGGVYETPWEENRYSNELNGSHRLKEKSSRPTSQPNMHSAYPPQGRKSSQPTLPGLTDYDTPWEYKSQFAPIGPPKPSRLNRLSDTFEVNPDIPLDNQSWYHGPITRLEAEELLHDAPDCSYLVRNSESSKKDFSLSMKNNESFLHLKIVRQLDGQFILGQFSKPFLDIPKVISHYSKNKLNIRGAEHKLLKHPVAVQPEYHTIEPDDS